MSEVPLPNPLESTELEGHSLQQWHYMLTSDESGEPTGHLLVPCSRYGRTGADVAWWAIACEVIYVDANGPSDDAELALEFYMGLAVNDHDDIASLVKENWHAVPEALRPYLDEEVLA